MNNAFIPLLRLRQGMLAGFGYLAGRQCPRRLAGSLLGLLLGGQAFETHAQCSVAFTNTSGVSSQVSSVGFATQPLTPTCSGVLTSASLSCNVYNAQYTAEVRTAGCGGGTLLASSSGSSYNATTSQVTFTFATPAAVTANTTYYIYYRLPTFPTLYFASGSGSSDYTPQFSNCQSSPANLIGSYAVTLPPPTITAFASANGLPGTEVTITGTNLHQVRGVRFGTGGLGLFTAQSATSLTVRVPETGTTARSRSPRRRATP